MLDRSAMDPQLVASLARARLRAAVVGHVAEAGKDGMAALQLVASLKRLCSLASVPVSEIDWVTRSLERDGLLVVEAGHVKLGPAALRVWAEQKIAAVAPETP